MNIQENLTSTTKNSLNLVAEIVFHCKWQQYQCNKCGRIIDVVIVSKRQIIPPQIRKLLEDFTYENAVNRHKTVCKNDKKQEKRKRRIIR